MENHPCITIGKHIGEYRVERLLGRGGFAAVYLARDLHGGRVALKIALPKDSITRSNVANSDAQTDETRPTGIETGTWGHVSPNEVLLREYEDLLRISDPRFVSVEACGFHEECFYVVMEYVDGTLLRHCMVNGAKVHISWFVTICDALQAARTNGLAYHGDIKPRNVIITSEGIKILDPTSGATNRGRPIIVTTSAYNPFRLRSDVPSIGSMLYELSTGCLPFRGSHRAISNEFVPPVWMNPDIPPRFDEVICKALSLCESGAAFVRTGGFEGIVELRSALQGLIDSGLTAWTMPSSRPVDILLHALSPFLKKTHNANRLAQVVRCLVRSQPHSECQTLASIYSSWHTTDDKHENDEGDRDQACKGQPVPASPDLQSANPGPRVCAQCDETISAEGYTNLQGELVCATCAVVLAAIGRNLINGTKAAESEPLAIPGYQIVKQIGGGGISGVYLANHDESGEQVALKVMPPHVALSAKMKADFLRNVELLTALKHPNVVKILDVGWSRNTFFIAQEYCDEGSVAALMADRSGVLQANEAVGIILQALDGLEYAHNAAFRNVKLKDGTTGSANGILHRDMRPQNILLSGSGKSRVAKVGDYAIAHAVSRAGLEGTEIVSDVGSVKFLSRQQVINFRHVRPDIDVWATAAVLYYMLTGCPPRDFPGGENPYRIILDCQPIPIRERNASIPIVLADVIDQALVDQPEIHFKTAAELKNALEGAMR